MKLQTNHYFANTYLKKMLYRTVLACLLVLVLFSTAAGSGSAPAQALTSSSLPGPHFPQARGK